MITVWLNADYLSPSGRGLSQFVTYFKEELKDQIKGKPPKKW